MNTSNRRICNVIVALTAGIALSSIAQADAPPATWATKEASFTFQGFTTKYTCDGLHDKVRALLLALGARKDDLKVRRTGCTGSTLPEHFPGVNITASVLQPASSDAGALVSADWKTLEFTAGVASVLDRGDCELVEQLRPKVLTLFATRNIAIPQSCVPHQLPTGTLMLRIEVLMPQPEKVAK